jgi:hypothetical protein
MKLKTILENNGLDPDKLPPPIVKEMGSIYHTHTARTITKKVRSERGRKGALTRWKNQGKYPLGIAFQDNIQKNK